MSDETHIATITKNRVEELRIGLSEFRGHDLINCRIWANYDAESEPKRPTKKGFALAVTMLPVLINTLQEAERVATAQGLLEVREPAAGASMVGAGGNEQTILGAG